MASQPTEIDIRWATLKVAVKVRMESHWDPRSQSILAPESSIMNVRTSQQAITNKMLSRGAPPEVVESFLRMLEYMRDEQAAYIHLDEVSTPNANHLLDMDSRPDEVKKLEQRGGELLSRAAVIKLNGGRSTTMGGEVPKGILIAKDGLSYLEIVGRQMDALKQQWGVDVPLLLMNSFFTEAPTRDVLERFGIQATAFLQSDAPRLVEECMVPLETGTEDDWSPLGHGDVYEALQRTGLLDRLLDQGLRWVFISNMDNLAASLEPWILGLMERDGIEFLLEVTDRTEVDRKGGTLVVRNGQLDLLELAQVAPSERARFMDIEQFRVFNTNNVWVDLETLADALRSGGLRMPVIRNPKTVADTRVVQLEKAMGSAVRCFGGARGLRVGRDRFFPTKKVEDLFLLQSDACVLDSMYRIRRNPARPQDLPLRPRVIFGDDFLASPLKMATRFEDPSSVSLVNAVCLEVHGPAFFEADVKISGRVAINAPPETGLRIERGSILHDARYP